MMKNYVVVMVSIIHQTSPATLSPLKLVVEGLSCPDQTSPATLSPMKLVVGFKEP
jgi:hypothetical protein